MKGNISRDSHRPGNRYSGVYQVQGGMVTDADLGEQASIARGRTDGLGRDTAGSGVPVAGGMVDLDGGPGLVPGLVYAEGRRGEVQASAEFSGPLGLYAVQVDFPLAPDLPQQGEHFLYVDIWDRMVSHLEDAHLSDPGLHGAETAFRARTMAQVKCAPLDQMDQLGTQEGAIPASGNGELTVTPTDPEIAADECDPCADTVAAEQTVANALFRIEVVHVFGDPQAPDRVRLAWSAENAAAIAPATVNSEDFERAGAVYEFFSTVTESHLGVHEQNGAVARSSFATSLAAGPSDPAAPEGGDWPFVRRWDGTADVDLAGNAVATEGSGTVALAGSVVTLTTDAFAAELDFGGRAIVAGDYWLIEMRRFAEDPIRAVQTLPIGIHHSFCPLFRLTDGAVEPLTDAETRRLSFPALADLPASHVGFDNNCPKLFDNAENVQEALDNLCSIEAADIAFDPAGCPRLFDQTDNVQDALINLCKVDFGNGRLLRLLHDWGVICGVIPRRRGGPAEVEITGGAILDRAGVIGDVDADTIELNKLLRTEFFHFDGIDAFQRSLKRKEVCLALSVEEGGVIRYHLAPRSRAFGPADPTFLTVLAECRAKRPLFDLKDDLTTRPAAERATLDKVFYGAAYSKIAASQRLNSQEQVIARNYNDDLVGRYKTHLGDDADAAQFDQKIAAIDAEIRPGEATGEVRETRFMMREALVYRAVRETEAERLRRCLCEALAPRCPTPGEPPHLVPIACVEGSMDGETFFLTEICTWCCRKQAMSWRMVQYYLSEMRDRVADQVRTICCPEEEQGGGGVVFDRPDDFVAVAELDRRLTPDRLWLDAERGARILTGQNPPSDYSVQPKVGDLGLDQAKRLLAGNGIEVGQTIDASDAQAIAKIRGATVGLDARDLIGDRGAVMPGDKVALIMQDGVAIDYVKLETGGGKFIFDRPAISGAAISDDLRAQVAEMEGRLSGRIAAAETSATEFDAEWESSLKRRSEALAAQTAEAEQALEGLKAEREALSTEVADLRTAVDAAKTEHGVVVSDIAAARADLDAFTEAHAKAIEEAEKQRDTLVESLRRETPIAAVTGEEANFSNELARRGVTNVAGLAELPDEDLRTVAGAAGLNMNTARRLQREASTLLTRPLR